MQNDAKSKLYGLSLAQFTNMLEFQSGSCAICKVKQGERLLCVDHDHATNKIRGLLCSRCNLLVGVLEWEYVEEARQYLGGSS